MRISLAIALISCVTVSAPGQTGTPSYSREEAVRAREGRFLSAQGNWQPYHYSTNVPAMIKAAGAIESALAKERADEYVRMVSIMCWDLNNRSYTNEAARELAVELAGKAAARLSEAGLDSAARALAGLSAGPWGNYLSVIATPSGPIRPEDIPPTLEQLPREHGLEAFLGVIPRVDTFMRTNQATNLADFNYLTYQFTDPKWLTVPKAERSQAIREAAAQLKEAEQLVNLWKELGPRGSYRQSDLEQRLTKFLQTHFDQSPADLDEVQLALEKHLTHPALWERVVLAAYKGKNPFLGRVVAPRPAGIAPGSRPARTSAATRAGHAAAVSLTPAKAVGEREPHSIPQRTSVLGVAEPTATDSSTANVRAAWVIGLVGAALLGWMLLRARHSPR